VWIGGATGRPCGTRTAFETDAAIEVGEVVRTEARDTAPVPRPT